MSDKKLTDSEIVKGLEICSNNGDCKECPINPHHGNYGYCTSLAIKAALDLINRQKAEIEQWKEEANRYQTLWCEDVQIARAEAYKEFAERLKERAIQTSFDPIYGSIMTVDVDDVDNLLKEKVGEQNG